MTHLSDSSSIIQLLQQRHAAGLFTAVAPILTTLHARDVLFSVRQVLTELSEEDDPAFAWAQANPTLFLPDATAEVHGYYSRIETLVSIFANSKVERFLAKADPWLIAWAVELGWTVISQEVPLLLDGERYAKGDQSGLEFPMCAYI